MSSYKLKINPDDLVLDDNPDDTTVFKMINDLVSYYPNIYDWINRKIENRNENIRIVVPKIYKESVGISITQNKGLYVKISTFYILKKFRGIGIGSFLLNNELEYWRNKLVDDFIITYSSKVINKNPKIEKFLDKFNFQCIKILSNRYITNENEQVFKIII